MTFICKIGFPVRTFQNVPMIAQDLWNYIQSLHIDKLYFTLDFTKFIYFSATASNKRKQYDWSIGNKRGGTFNVYDGNH